jgi:replicative superfamily II helicase
MQVTNQLCYDKAVEQVKKGHQVLVFVHSRKNTYKCAKMMMDMAEEREELDQVCMCMCEYGKVYECVSVCV